MTSYHLQTIEGMREITMSEWLAVERQGYETYSLRSVEGMALIVVLESEVEFI